MGAASSYDQLTSRRRWLALFALAAANLAVLVVVSSGISTLADVLAPLTGHLIGLGFTASVALLVRRWMLSLLAAGAAATLGVHAWLGLAWCCGLPSSPPPADVTKVAARAPAQGLSVLALNTWDHHPDPSRLAGYLASAAADVVILSEFGADKRLLLGALKSAYPHQSRCGDTGKCSLALLSRLPLEASGIGSIAAEGPDFVWARLEGSLTIIGTHLHRPSRNPWRHERQMLALAEFLRRIDGPLVLAGDLNTSPWSGSFRRLRSTTGLTPAGILIPTWPAWPVAVPQVALDHVLVSPDLAVTAAGTGPAVGSDHLPVWARIERRAPLIERARPQPSRLTSRLAAARPHLGGELLGDFGGEQVGAGHLRR